MNRTYICMPQNSSVCKLLWNEFWSCNSAVVPSPQKTLWNHSLPKKGHKQEAVKREHTDWHLNRHTLKCKIVYNRLRELTQRWDSRNLLQRCMHLRVHTHKHPTHPKATHLIDSRCFERKSRRSSDLLMMKMRRGRTLWRIERPFSVSLSRAMRKSRT